MAYLLPGKGDSDELNNIIMEAAMKFRIRVNISGENVELYKTAKSEDMALIFALRNVMKVYGISYANAANRYYEVKPIKSTSVEGGRL